MKRNLNDSIHHTMAVAANDSAVSMQVMTKVIQSMVRTHIKVKFGEAIEKARAVGNNNEADRLVDLLEEILK